MELVFGNIIKWANGNGSSFDSRIDASGDNVYVAWLNKKTGANQIYFRAINDTVSTFRNEIMISNKTSGTGVS